MISIPAQKSRNIANLLEFHSCLRNAIIVTWSIINEENILDVEAWKANVATLYYAFKVRMIVALIILL